MTKSQEVKKSVLDIETNMSQLGLDDVKFIMNLARTELRKREDK